MSKCPIGCTPGHDCVCEENERMRARIAELEAVAIIDDHLRFEARHPIDQRIDLTDKGREALADSERVQVKVKLAPGAKLPTYAKPGDAGADIHALHTVNLGPYAPHNRMVIQTGVHVQPPPGWHFSVRPKSGLSSRGLVVVPGLVDSEYRGAIGVIIVNLSGEARSVQAGDKVAQLVLERIPQAAFETVDELDETERNMSGWGSSGR